MALHYTEKLYLYRRKKSSKDKEAHLEGRRERQRHRVAQTRKTNRRSLGAQVTDWVQPGSEQDFGEA